MTRRHDWAARLFDVIAAHDTRPFAWGVDDCCLFAARAIDAMTDRTLEARLGDLYQDEVSARALIERHGSLVEAITAILGETPQAVRAMRGDLVEFDGGAGDAVGICLGPLHRRHGAAGAARGATQRDPLGLADPMSQVVKGIATAGLILGVLTLATVFAPAGIAAFLGSAAVWGVAETLAVSAILNGVVSQLTASRRPPTPSLTVNYAGTIEPRRIIYGQVQVGGMETLPPSPRARTTRTCIRS
jgi:hypothetical protein